MNRGLSDRLLCLILGAAVTGLVVPSSIVLGQTRSAVSSNKKKPAVVQVVEPPQLLTVPENSGSAVNPILPVSQLEIAAAEKSDVQRELEALYQQEGREMPDLNMSMPLTPLTAQPPQSDSTNPPAATRPSQPKPTTTQKPAARPAQTYPGNSSRPGATVYAPQTPAQLPAQNPSQATRYSNLFNDNASTPPVQPQAKQPSQTSKFGFFKRLTSSSKSQYNPAPVPPDFKDIPAGVPGVPPASAANTPTAAPVQQGMKYYTPPNQTSPGRPESQPGLASVKLNSVPGQPTADAQFQMTNNSVTSLPQPSIQLPPLFQQPLPILTSPSKSSTEPLALPPLMTEAQQPIMETSSPANTKVASATPSNTKIAITETITETLTDFPDPFPESSEVDTDDRSNKLPMRREISPKAYAEDDTPKSTVVIQVKPESAQDPASRLLDDPFAVGAKNFAEPSTGSNKTSKSAASDKTEFLPPVVAKSHDWTETPVQSSLPNSTQPSAKGITPEFDVARILEAPPATGMRPAQDFLPSGLAPGSENQKLVPPSIEEEEQQHLEKMRRIRERFGMKGLKGFCPVTLHDERDLVDAKSEFYFIHRSQKFHFATAEARDKFAADPVKYAPAAYGADVVALDRDRDVVEGTLDYAAWFNGRLYLFGSQENYEIFIDNPARYATLSGIE